MRVAISLHTGRAIRARFRRASSPAVLSLTPQTTLGGVRLAGKKEVASLRTSCWGLKGRRKGLPPRAAIQAAPPRRRPASCRPNAVPTARAGRHPASAGSAVARPPAVGPRIRCGAVRFPSWETGPPRFTFSLVHYCIL